MNLPNSITLSRIPLTFAIVGLMYCEWRGAASLALVLFIVCAISDWLDGYLARKQGLVSTFGVFMDALADKVCVLGILIALSERRMILPEYEIIPMVLILVTLTREFLVTGMRLVAALRGVVVAADRGGKQKTVTQLIALAALLLVPVIERDIPAWAELKQTVPSLLEWIRMGGFLLLVFATLLALYSGIRYFLRCRHLLEGPPK